jgi:hypothetical protein
MHSFSARLSIAVVCLVIALLAIPVASAWQAAPAPSEAVERGEFQPTLAPKIALRAALYLPQEVCGYKFHYLFTTQNVGAAACPRILQQLQASFSDVIRIDQLAGAHNDVDILIAVQRPSAHLWQSGLMHGSSSLSLDFAAYSPTAAVIVEATEKAAMKGLSNNDTIRSSYADLTGEECAHFLQKLKATPFVIAALKPPPPAPVVPPPPQLATLDISSTASAQVYVDDEFKGTTSSDGHLVVSLPPGAHKLRLSEPGKKEWLQPLLLVAGERHPVSAQLEAAGPKPLAEGDIEEALSNGLPKARVLALVRQYGVSFGLSEPVEERLRKAGADDEVLLAIVKNKK